jgi:hypothetical protein
VTAETEGIGPISERLREIAERMRDPELSDADTEALAREAADLVARAGNEIERLLREAAEGE